MLPVRDCVTKEQKKVWLCLRRVLYTICDPGDWILVRLLTLRGSLALLASGWCCLAQPFCEQHLVSHWTAKLVVVEIRISHAWPFATAKKLSEEPDFVCRQEDDLNNGNIVQYCRDEMLKSTFFWLYDFHHATLRKRKQSTLSITINANASHLPLSKERPFPQIKKAVIATFHSSNSGTPFGV